MLPKEKQSGAKLDGTGAGSSTQITSLQLPDEVGYKDPDYKDELTEKSLSATGISSDQTRIEERSKRNSMPDGKHIMEGPQSCNTAITIKQISPDVICYLVSINAALLTKDGLYYFKFKTGRQDENEWLAKFHMDRQRMVSTSISVTLDYSIQFISGIVTFLQPRQHGPYECDFTVNNVEKIFHFNDDPYCRTHLEIHTPIKMSLSIFERTRSMHQINSNKEAIDVLFTSKSDGDVCLYGSDWERSLFCHKSVVFSRFPTFRDILNQEPEENVYQIDMSSIDLEIAKAILVYIYTGAPINLHDSAERLLNAADLLEIQDLKILCEEHLCQNTTVENVCERLEFAEKSELDQLRRRCIALMISRKDDVTKTNGWLKLRQLKKSLADAIDQNTLMDHKRKKYFLGFDTNYLLSYIEEYYIILTHHLNQTLLKFPELPLNGTVKVLLLIFIYLFFLPTITESMDTLMRFAFEFIMYHCLYKIIYIWMEPVKRNRETS